MADDYWLAVVRTLSWETSVWKRMKRILSGEGAEPQVSGFFFKAVVQAVMLFSSETWVGTPRMGRVLGEFQYQVARRMGRQIPRRKIYGKWEYTLLETAREEVGFQTMEEYIRRRKSTVAQ